MTLLRHLVTSRSEKFLAKSMQNCFTYNKQLHVQGSLQSMRPSPMLGAPLLITVNRDVPQTRTAKELYNCMPQKCFRSSILKNSPHVVHFCMLSVPVRWHHMAELLTHLRYSHHQSLTTQN